MALKNGAVLTWGNNGNNQLGDNTFSNRLTPIKVLGQYGTGYLSGVTAIAGGNDHSLAIMNDGTVFTWGYNGYGQLGNGITTYSPTPD